MRHTLPTNEIRQRITAVLLCSNQDECGARLARAAAISQTAASKLCDANCRMRASDVMAKRSICTAARLGIPSWVTATPFGVPVEPEV